MKKYNDCYITYYTYKKQVYKTNPSKKRKNITPHYQDHNYTNQSKDTPHTEEK